MKQLGKIIFGIFASVVVTSCIENDIPFPRLDCTMSAVSVEGSKGYTTTIHGDTTIVTIDIDENVDLRAVKFGSLSIANQDKATIRYADGRSLTEGDSWNLRRGEVLFVNIYGYLTPYKFVGTQSVEKRFRVEGQMGDSYFEENVGEGVENRIALANVPKGTDFSQINVLELKLGPEGCTTLSPNIVGVTDFTSTSGEDHIKVVTVSYRDVVQTWRIIIQEGSTSVTRVNAWAKSATIYAAGVQDEEHIIEYRRAGESTWSRATLSSDAEGTFVADIKGLTPDTDYECRALSNGEESGVMAFTTEAAPDLQNAGFEDWELSGKALWLPYTLSDPIIHTFTDPTHPGEEFKIRYWDTGNHGAITLGSSNSIPLSAARAANLTSIAPYEGEDAAFLQSKFVGIGVAGKLAGGNIFTGTFGVVQGTNGTTYLGIPFTSRPKRLVGYYQYKPQPINRVLKPDGVDGTFITSDWADKSDTLNMVFALADWKIPHEVRTDRKNRMDFTPKTPGLIAWGNFTSAEETNDWTRFEIPLEFFDEYAKPNHMVVMITSSKWSDYFTGGDNSALIIDGLHLEYE
ncbi:MAG: PCMD domain-containing protein [Rikenellaceae bacterium]|nr:PCMD domain-containing protein [Rikenellaceae bacterium]